MKRLFSGMQPTGSPHIGNYLGAVRNWVDLQDEYDAFYCVVDLHAITVDYDSASMQDRIHDMAAVLLACGLDPPERCTLFVQSHVPQHTELAWILNTVTPMAELQRMTQFKAKAAEHQKNINIGLFAYPVLQAADILLYMGQVVPVGEDQVQHIELSRIIARKFNNRFSALFPEPWEKVSFGKRIRGLDGSSKMSKTLNNQIDILDDADTVWEKLRSAFTDPARKRKADPGTPEKCNIHTLLTFFATPEEVAWAEEGCRTAGIGCFQCKRVLCDRIVGHLKPIRDRALLLIEDRTHVQQVLALGAQKAADVAADTMAAVKAALGLSQVR